MSKKIFIRNPYNYDADAVSDETGLICDDPSLAQQHMKDECDINILIERFGVNAVAVMPLADSFGDFTGVADYHSALNTLMSTQEQFMALPAKIRAKFDHDPYRLVNFLMDEANRSEAIELGLIDGEMTASVIPPTGVESPNEPA